jgi:cysteine desulfurase/selenocysteine lyase
LDIPREIDLRLYLTTSLRRFGVETTVRPSLALYNNYGDIDALLAALRRLKRVGA